jgi:AAA domain, putative AbiEii toxin, Type IV TA system
MRHIDEFTIHRFRGMREAKFETLGQINLLVGGNNSGKTSVLEALSVFCDPLNPSRWSNVASARETREISSLSSRFSLSLSDRLLWLFPQEGLFPEKSLFPQDELFPRSGNFDAELLLSASGAYPLKNVSARIEKFSEVIKERIPRYAVEEDIGGRDDSSYEEREREVEGVKIEVGVSLKKNDNNLPEELLTATFKFPDYGVLPRGNTREISPLPVRSIHGCSHRSSGVSSVLWTGVIYADAKLQTVKLLQLFDPDIQDVDIILPRERASISIKHKKLGRAPLSAFGDGLRRVFTLASAIPGAKDGLLLIDELEIAVHTRMLEKTFNWLVEFCCQYDVQLFATTHSLEAVDAIIDACKDKDIDLVAYRLQQGDTQTTTKRFDKKYLKQLREELGVDLRW